MMVCSIEDGCLRFVAPADVVPLLGGLRTSAVIGAPSRQREETRIEHDGPTKVFVRTPPREERCRPEDRDAFHRYVEGRGRT
jgi:hypothetical protein